MQEKLENIFLEVHLAKTLLLKIFLYGPDDKNYEFRIYPVESALLNSTTVSILMNKQHILQMIRKKGTNKWLLCTSVYSQMNKERYF